MHPDLKEAESCLDAAERLLKGLRGRSANRKGQGDSLYNSGRKAALARECLAKSCGMLKRAERTCQEEDASKLWERHERLRKECNSYYYMQE